MLINSSAEFERRTLRVVGAIVLLAIVSVIVVAAMDPFRDRPANVISVVIDTPYVGQGVSEGTAVVMHGVSVGTVTAIASRPGGGVRLNAELQTTPCAGLTDTMRVDFRPVNYFRVPGINVAAGSGGVALHDGMHIVTDPTGNFTLQALLSRLGQVSTGALTPQLIQVIERASRYTDALDPLFETALIAAHGVARVRTVSTAQLLANSASLSDVFPGFVDAAVDAGDYLQHYVNYANFDILDLSDEDFQNRSNKRRKRRRKVYSPLSGVWRHPMLTICCRLSGQSRRSLMWYRH